MRSVRANVKLAQNWTVGRVRACLKEKQKHELIRFLHDRYTERFLGAIQCLRNAERTERGFGFAIMALCSLLIETVQCYLDGLPTSNSTDLKDLCDGLDTSKVETACGAGSNAGSRSEEVFKRFFKNEKHQEFFPNVNGAVYYKKIRCGLLHQAQTKGGWRIKRSGSFWDEKACTINRDDFYERLEGCFDAFLDELRRKDLGQDPWPNVERKICWLVETS